MDIQEVQNVIGAHLKQLRAARGWSQRELADRARISADFVPPSERGKRAPSIWVMTKISGVFGVDPFELLVPPVRTPKESEALRDLRHLLAGRSDKQVRLVWKLAKLVLEEGEQERTKAPARRASARRTRTA